MVLGQREAELEQQYDIWKGRVGELQARLEEWVSVSTVSYIYAYRVSAALRKLFPENAFSEEWPSTLHGWVCIEFYEKETRDGSKRILHNNLAYITSSYATKHIVVSVKCGDVVDKKILSGRNMSEELVGILGEIAIVGSDGKNS